MKALYLLASGVLAFLGSLSQINIEIPEDFFDNAVFSFNEVNVTGFYDNTYVRRDPSDVVYYKGKYRVYFSIAKRPNVNFDFNGEIAAWECTDTSSWQETEVLIPIGAEGTVDRYGLVAPAAAVNNDTLYVYYEGWGAASGDSTDVPTLIYTMVAWSVDGENFNKTYDTILAAGPNAIDANRASDPCYVFFNDTIRHYYKSRFEGAGADETTTSLSNTSGYATPCVKYDGGNPIIDAGHEPTMFKAGQYMVGFINRPHRPVQQFGYIYLSEDGINFNLKKIYELNTEFPWGSGIFKDYTQFIQSNSKPPTWGICHQPDINSNTRVNTLRMFTINYNQ